MRSFIIRHVTTYRYRQAVAFGEHRLMLRPRDGHDQRIMEMRLDIEPAPRTIVWSEDASGNLSGTARFTQRATELRFDATIRVQQEPVTPTATAIAQHAETCPFSYGAEEMPDLARFIERQYPDPEYRLDRWVRALVAELGPRDGRAVGSWHFLERLNATIRRDFAYLRRDEKGCQTPVETLRLGRGTCRDFAILMCEAARSQGLAARFVSGYLHVRPDPSGRPSAGGSTHAWLQVYLPGAGWIDFDPTSGTIGNDGLIRVALVRDPDRAAPLSGTFMGFPSDYIGMSVTVSMIDGDRDGTGEAGKACTFDPVARQGAVRTSGSTRNGYWPEVTRA